jgi:micrococcal nuclease
MKFQTFLIPGFLFFVITLLPRVCPATEFVTVTSVIDGETLKLSNGKTVRLNGIDVPASSKNAKIKDDMKDTGKDAVTLIAAGKDAAKFMRKLVKNEKIALEFDQKEAEKSGKLLAYVYFYLDPNLNMEIPEDWYAELCPETKERQLRVFLNATLIKMGLAQAKSIPPNIKFQDLFLKQQEEAKIEKRGLWA